MKGLSVLKKRNGFAGIYVHFPYCIHKCSYCDFFSIGIGKSVVTNQTELFEAYKSEIRLRIEENLDFSDYSIDSIYFGGGTPSLAETKLLGSFLSFLYKNFKDYIKINFITIYFADLILKNI